MQARARGLGKRAFNDSAGCLTELRDKLADGLTINRMAGHIFVVHFLLFQILLFHTRHLLAVISADPKIVYMDGHSRWDSCLPGLKRSVNGESGLLISHSAYGTQPYNGSKNCFLSVTVPLGYRIRIKALDFDVVGDVEDVTKTPCIFSIMSSQLTLCIWTISGKNSSRMAESTHNTLTLWWHTDANLSRGSHQAEGFRLLWSSFRARATNREECRKESEFRCTVSECIPLALGCNVYADCADDSDLDNRLQVQHNCEHIPGDVFSQLTGIKKLLICLLVALLFVCTSINKEAHKQNSEDALLTVNGYHHSQEQFEGKAAASDDQDLAQLHMAGSDNPPLPPNFSPPQVPSKMTVSAVPRVVVIQQQQQGSLPQQARTSNHHQPPFAVPENLSAIASSSSSHNNQSTASSLTTTAVGNLAASNNLLPRTTHLAANPAAQPRSVPITIQSQAQSRNGSAQQPAMNVGTGDYTYVQNEQKHLLL
uniref:CUB domain-containing protein n=1 Tax=Ditylenchus dipsaci TaxID=166011 RepID=A0A915D7J0_9BILA